MESVAQLYLSDKDLAFRWSQIKQDFWGDLKVETLHALQNLLTNSMEIQVQDLIGSDKWQHNYSRSAYRNGYRSRSLLTSFGYLANIKVPRVRSGSISFNCLPRYKQRASDIDSMVLNMFLSGVSTRKVKEVLAPLTGFNSISSSTVSVITKSLNKKVMAFHSRKLTDNYIYLIADGVYLNVKNPIWKKRRCVLVLYGITSKGVREIIGFQLAPHGESQSAWESFLYRLFYNGLKGSSLRLIARDGCKGLKNAMANVFPSVPQQLCWAHKLRNVANKLPKKLQAPCINQARAIYNANSQHEALKNFKHWVKVWNPIAPNAVKCLHDDIAELLHFFIEPQNLWIKLRTTNAIERTFREVRRRTRPISCFQNSDSVQRIIFAVFYRQNKIWENSPLKLTHFS